MSAAPLVRDGHLPRVWVDVERLNLAAADTGRDSTPDNTDMTVWKTGR